ncbi:hypothetical protein E4T47_02921 [Aureobasidium subglaciale]|nr:hypothetical protein E4T47_02921 [Aureobasidium subglaciale]
MDVDASNPLTLSPPPRPHSAPAASPESRLKQFSWNPADAARLGPSRITITRLYQRAPKAPFHHLQSQSRPLQNILPKSPGPQRKKHCATLDAGANPFRPQDDISDVSDDDVAEPVMIQDLRSSSAPPGDTNTPEPVLAPRISDDTAILHAFLSRAAANKRPMAAHKRESLENRRDSDAVRHALASTDKPEVLTELDLNSPTIPSSPKAQSSAGDAKPEPEFTKQEPTPEVLAPTPTKSKALRRTTRARTTAAAPKKPAKIAIRSAADHIALKRTEAQELALATRSNTRKNKGKSLMPQVRLLNIDEDFISSEDTAEDADRVVVNEKAQSEKSTVRRGVQWNETLTHVREFESDSPDSPPKTKARTSRVSARALEPFVPLTSTEEPLEEVVAEAIDMEIDIPEPESQKTIIQTPSEPTPPPRVKATIPSKRKSRIATPARSSKLAVAKSVVPTAAPLLPPPTLPAAAAAAPPHSSSSEPLTTSLGTPKKPPIPFTALKPTSLSSRLELAPKNDGVSSATTTASTTSLLPGLSSPAKKRVKTTLGRSAVRPSATTAGQKESGELPGLTSPAKRKRPGVKF